MTHLIIGLGNPGARYANTRHNIGHLVIDELANRSHESLASTKTRARAVKTRLGGIPGKPVILVKSLTYMNETGLPIRALTDFYGLSGHDVIAIHDDVDLPFEAIKLKRGGSEGGHNGLRSMSSHLGTRDYLRVRAGVGRPPGRMDTAAYVLKNFSADEAKHLPVFVSELADAVEALVTGGLENAQQYYHSRNP